MPALRKLGAAALLALAAAAGPAAAAAEPVRYRLDPDQTFVWFEVMHFGTSTLRGRMGPVQGDVLLDRAAGTGELGLRIATRTLDTGLRILDRRMAQPDLLDTEQSPEAYFVARRFRFEGDQLAEVRGEFTVRGTGIPLSLKALHFACRQDADRGAQVCGGDFEGRFRRSEFGITFGLPFVGDEVRLLVQVEGVRQ